MEDRSSTRNARGRPEERAVGTRARPGGALHRLGKIVVATDFSPGSARALARSAWLPLPDGAEIHLVHVLPPAAGPAEAPRARQILEESAAALIRGIGDAGRRRIIARPAVLEGAVFQQISRYCGEMRPDLILAGRHGRQGVREFFLGSTAEQLVRKLGLPVLVVRTEPGGSHLRPRLAADLTASDSQVLAWLLSIVSRPELVAVHAVEEIPHGSILVAGAEPDEERAYYGRRESAAVKRLRTLGRQAAQLGARLVPVVRKGSPVPIVLAEAATHDCDLLAIGNRGKAGLSRLFAGTVSGGIVVQASCDVLIVPTPKNAT